MNVVIIVGQAFILLGAAIFVVAAIGLLRLPDLFTRTSAIGTAAGVGISFLVLGVALQDLSWVTLAKAALAIGLQLLTSVVGAIAISRAAVLSGHTFAEGTDTSDPQRLGVLDPATSDETTLPQEPPPHA
ncbi:cation:proton antiporter [Ornithinimicrobium sp. LYQ92]|uniref:cation:proton antiporter n=1 Tax=Serinicoccus sp. LYQ92 TaxID=3378798 RepID=UPI003853B9D6